MDYVIEYLAGSPQLRDLHLIQYGIERCTPHHAYGPAVRDHYLLHFVLEGYGIFEAKGKTYRLQPGQAFLIFPGEVTYYQADETTPWYYAWVEFEGVQAESFLQQAGLTVDSPILPNFAPQYILRYIKQMVASKEMSCGRELQLTSQLFGLMAHIIERNADLISTHTSTDQRGIYVQKVLDFIETNYANPISIEQIADFIGLNRSYLGAVFKDRTQSSIRQYLIRYRMNKACELMSNPLLSIGDIARSVGYEDPLLFSKMFKKVIGQSPRYYRNSLAEKKR